jgi:hypothetical protein
MKIMEIADPSIKNVWKRGETAYFEYHCCQGHDSADAQLWYRSHQSVTVLGISGKGYGKTIISRLYNGHPRVYTIRFQDGTEGGAFEDELLTSPEFYEQQFCPPPENERQLSIINNT